MTTTHPSPLILKVIWLIALCYAQACSSGNCGEARTCQNSNSALGTTPTAEDAGAVVVDGGVVAQGDVELAPDDVEPPPDGGVIARGDVELAPDDVELAPDDVAPPPDGGVLGQGDADITNEGSCADACSSEGVSACEGSELTTSCGQCDDDCSEGEKTCSDGELQTCETDSNGCLVWSAPTTCQDEFCASDTTCGAAPVITSDPSSRTVDVGQSVAFNVTATGTKPFTYQWRRNGQPVGTDPSYTLSNPGLNNDGDEIDVVVSNEGGSATSKTATLSVNDVAPDAPSGFTADKNGYSSIVLNWIDESENEAGFQIERSSSPSSGFASIVTTIVDATTYADNSVVWGTLYYYRIRATNAVGNSAYVGPIEGTAWECGDDFSDNRGGTNTTYPSVDIDGQCWMQRNLEYAGTGAHYCYSDVASNCAVYGRLYHQSVTADACPSTWQMPTIADWQTLQAYASTLPDSSSGGILALMDESATNFGFGDSVATNLTGFSGLPGGYYYWNSSSYVYSGEDWEATWWAADAGTSNRAVFHASGDGPFAAVSENSAGFGNSSSRAYIRCIKK